MTHSWEETRLMTELDGATHRGPDNAYPANAGEFAARWNAKTEEERNGWVAFMVDGAMEAQRADRNAIEWAARVQAAESRIAALEAVIEKARDWQRDARTRVGLSNGFHTYLEYGEFLLSILDSAPSTVLDQMIREAKAEALENAARPNGGYPEWATNQKRIDRPYDWVAWLLYHADTIRNGDA